MTRMSAAPCARTSDLAARSTRYAATRPSGEGAQRSLVEPCARAVAASRPASSAQSLCTDATMQVAGCCASSLGQRALVMSAATVEGACAWCAWWWSLCTGLWLWPWPWPWVPWLAALAGCTRVGWAPCAACAWWSMGPASSCPSACIALSLARRSSTGWNSTHVDGSSSFTSSSSSSMTLNRSNRAAGDSSTVTTADARCPRSMPRTRASTSAASLRLPSMWGTPGCTACPAGFPWCLLVVPLNTWCCWEWWPLWWPLCMGPGDARSRFGFASIAC
mmetsp:Transcript_4979/g.12224  ORF Transcript_4979/g.12224 Transcript_4979/m.12224 type:complete len:277 (+) Transcript_4979:1915-2745(+)